MHMPPIHVNAKVKLRLDILCIIGAPNETQTQTPISSSPKHIVQFIKFKHLPYLVLNKRVLDNKQPPPKRIGITSTLTEPTSQRTHSTLYCITKHRNQHKAIMFAFMSESGYMRIFSFFLVVIFRFSFIK